VFHWFRILWKKRRRNYLLLRVYYGYVLSLWILYFGACVECTSEAGCQWRPEADVSTDRTYEFQRDGMLEFADSASRQSGRPCDFPMTLDGFGAESKAAAVRWR
jgi:hypothetical protein